MLVALRLPTFRLLLIGLTTSMAGDSMMLLVLAVWAKELTGSSASAGFVLLCIAAPYLLVPMGGWLIDRFARRPFLVLTNLLSAVMLMPLVLVDGRADVWLLYVVASGYGLSGIMVSAALNGLLKDLVPHDLLAEANAATQTIKQGLRLGGPLVGTLLFASVGGATVAAIDAVSFLVAALVIARISVPTGSESADGQPSRGSRMTDGVRHLVRDGVLRRMMIAGATAMLVIGLIESVMFAVIDVGLNRPPQFIGVVSVAQGVGAIAGGLAAARLAARLGEMGTGATGLLAFGAGAGLTAAANLATVLTGFCILGFGIPVLVVAMTTMVQRRTPNQLLGQTSATFDMVLSGPQTLAIALGAALVDRVDYRILLLVIVVGTWAAAALLWTGRRLTPALTRAVAVPTPIGVSLVPESPFDQGVATDSPTSACTTPTPPGRWPDSPRQPTRADP